MVDRVMVLWSGGVESTSLLKYLLSESDVEVIAHHIRMTNPEGRMSRELNAIADLEPRLQTIRPFRVVYSDVSICGGNCFPMDYEVQYPLGLLAMRHEGCSKLFRAGCLEDDWDHTQDAAGRLHFERPSLEPGFSHRRRAETLQVLLKGKNPHEIAPWLPFYGRPKTWHIRYLGELFQYTWSCRKPDEQRNPCFKCHSCLERQAGISGTSLIPEVRTTLRK